METVVWAVKWSLAWFLALVAVYTVIKVATSAYFKSKEEHIDRRKEDG